MAKRTLDGLSIVSEDTFREFLRNYDITSENNNPEVTKRIKKENPQLYRILKIGMENAPDGTSRAYYEMGMQIAYELLRRQSAKNKEK